MKMEKNEFAEGKFRLIKDFIKFAMSLNRISFAMTKLGDQNMNPLCIGLERNHTLKHLSL